MSGQSLEVGKKEKPASGANINANTVGKKHTSGTVENEKVNTVDAVKTSSPMTAAENGASATSVATAVAKAPVKQRQRRRRRVFFGVMIVATAEKQMLVSTTI